MVEEERVESTDWDQFNKWLKRDFLYKSFYRLMFRGYERLLKGITFDHEISILEFGGGSGYLTRGIARKYPTRKITILDFNRKNLDICEQNLSDVNTEKDFLLVDFFDFDTVEKYDIVHSQGIIEHFNEQQKRIIVRKHLDYAGEDGHVIMFFPTPSLAYRTIRWVAELTNNWIFVDEEPIDFNEIETLLQASGRKIARRTLVWRCFLTEMGVLVSNGLH